MQSFSMRPAKYFYDKPLPKYLDTKTVLIYRPHPVESLHFINVKLTIMLVFMSCLFYILCPRPYAISYTATVAGSK